MPILLGEIFKLSGQTRLLYYNISMMLLVSGIWISLITWLASCSKRGINVKRVLSERERLLSGFVQRSR